MVRRAGVLIALAQLQGRMRPQRRMTGSSARRPRSRLSQPGTFVAKGRNQLNRSMDCCDNQRGPQGVRTMRKFLGSVQAGLRLALLFAAFATFWPAAAAAEKRVALVIGNDRYPSLPSHQQLQRAGNDAEAIGTALQGIGFEVIRGRNLDRQAMIDKIAELTTRLSEGDTASTPVQEQKRRRSSPGTSSRRSAGRASAAWETLTGTSASG